MTGTVDETRPFVPTDEQQALRDAVEDYVDRHWDDARLRGVLESGAPDPRDLRILGTELGVLGIALPEAAGGGGGGVAEVAVVAERLGRRLAAVPFFSAVLAMEVLNAAGAEPGPVDGLLDGLLDGLVAGERLVVVAASDERGRWLPGRPSVAASLEAGAWTLNGVAAHVVDAPAANVLLVLADTPDGSSLFAVDSTAPGVALSAITSLDLTRPQASVTLDATPGTPVGEPGSGAAIVAAACDRALVCLAAEALGAAERLLEVSVEYAASRLQFGRAIGSYQGVKHRLADLLVAVEQTRSVVEHAAWTADHPDDDGADDPALTASCARVLAAETLIEAAASAVQVHGGIGFTWEHLAHLYFKRAHSDAVLWGGLGPHRERIAELVLDVDPPRRDRSPERTAGTNQRSST